MLLVHGILHLLGFDHEIGAEESIAMAEAERYILNSLQWKVQVSKLPFQALLQYTGRVKGTLGSGFHRCMHTPSCSEASDEHGRCKTSNFTQSDLRQL